MGERRGGTIHAEMINDRWKRSGLTDHTQVVLSPLTLPIEIVESVARVSAIIRFIDVVDSQLIASDDKLRYFTNSNR